MRKIHLIAASITSAACLTSLSHAAKPIDLSTQSLAILQPAAAKPNLAQAQTAIKETRRRVDFNQTSHIRIQQTYAGSPVWGADGVVHVPHGGQTASLAAVNTQASMNGTIYEDLQADLSRTPASALQGAQADKALQQAIKLHKEKTSVTTSNKMLTEKKLIVYVDNKNKAHWAFYVSFTSTDAQGKTAIPTYILDAVSFAVYQTWNNLQSISVAAGGYGGNPKMGKLIYDGAKGNYPTLAMQRNAKNVCLLKNADVLVKDDTNYDSVINAEAAPIVQFKCDSTNNPHHIYWDETQDSINGGYSPANDALYIGGVIKKLYREWYQLNVLEGTLRFHIHTKDPESGKPMDNAFFHPMTHGMYFGDGASAFYPLTSVGVGAHEVSHGITATYSNLQYEGQSGGMNEAFSDMAAQAAEFYSTGKNSWQIGAEIVKGSDGALRYMDEPTHDGESIDNAKNFDESMNVHHTSGVYNKAFYLLATTDGWGVRKAFDVMLKANMDYWTAKTDFLKGACGVVKAAKDYGYSTGDVAKAMLRVGIDTRSC